MDGDVNQMLLATTTASAEGIQASERWLMRPKKRGSATANTTANAAKASKKARPEADADANDGPMEVSAGGDVGACASSSPSVCAVEGMVHRLVEYVIERQLGGRHNASRGDGKDLAPLPRAVLCAETSTMRPVALFHVHHTVYGSTSTTQSEKAPDAIVRYRKKLHVCSHDRDLVGGAVDGRPLHTRRHLLTLVTKGLRGERIDELPVKHAVAEEGQKMVDTQHDVVVLFDSAKQGTLSSFLQDSSSSSDDDNE
ncbi:hypothetical protein DQ04_00441050 [Trypanosoma grayi]|uniref:hypothetical protein n=1 Tax=Trypanosoma grayi TaxID=71804 RepID=UPI0004F404B6|nr:hypothetical protein DQ04_00441050 [Trypanosoma grayi]KEG14480.1 hypothetical protein DQ04_00441050 [Trypanosoma grayi]